MNNKDFERQSGNHTYTCKIVLENMTSNQMDALDEVLNLLYKNGVKVKTEVEND